MSWKAAKTFPRWLIVDSTPRLRNVKRQKFLLSSIAVARNVKVILYTSDDLAAKRPWLSGDTIQRKLEQANLRTQEVAWQ